jgi:hypothetical protein
MYEIDAEGRRERAEEAATRARTASLNVKLARGHLERLQDDVRDCQVRTVETLMRSAATFSRPGVDVRR